MLWGNIISSNEGMKRGILLLVFSYKSHGYTKKKLFFSNKSKLEYYSLFFFPKLQTRLHLKMFFEMFARRCGLAVKAPV